MVPDILRYDRGKPAAYPKRAEADRRRHVGEAQLVGSGALAGLSAHNHALLVGRSFFPRMISAPFRTGLHEAFAFAIVACLVAALASYFRGGLSRDELPPPASADPGPRAPALTGG